MTTSNASKTLKSGLATSRLAIVIPAYKGKFLAHALESIANQTCKDFTLYVGDDASEDQLSDICALYADRLHIEYNRFDQNFGKANLVSQWERCIDMAGNEEWLWLFSDDDMMDANCVESFYSALAKDPEENIFHFNVVQVDAAGKSQGAFFDFPETMSSKTFLLTRLKRPEAFSTAVEYIFRKSHFIKNGRFTNFDLAWASDDATWIKLAQPSGIKTIDGARVFWRASSLNISTINNDRSLSRRKLKSELAFAAWLLEGIESKALDIRMEDIQPLLKRRLYLGIKYRVHYLSFRQIIRSLFTIRRLLKLKAMPLKKLAFLVLYKVFKSIDNKMESIVSPVRVSNN